MNLPASLISHRLRVLGLHMMRRKCTRTDCDNTVESGFKKKYCCTSCYEKHRHATDPVFRVKRTVCRRIEEYLKNGSKSEKTFTIVGYTEEDLIAHLQAAPLYDKWLSDSSNRHIDHIIQLAAYGDALGDENHPYQKLAWNLRNLRIMYGPENRDKSTTVDYALIERYGIMDLLPDYHAR